MAGLALADFEKAALVDFRENAITDDRVRFERAPFDHPELALVNGTQSLLEESGAEYVIRGPVRVRRGRRPRRAGTVRGRRE